MSNESNQSEATHVSPGVSTSIAYDLAWNAKQAELGAHMLQSSEWLAFQQALSRPVAREAAERWSWAASLVRGRGYSYVAVPYGPTVKSIDDMASALTSLRAWAVEMGADFVRLEPMGGIGRVEVDSTGLVPATESQPSLTRFLDLSSDEDALRRGLASGHRNAVNQAWARKLDIKVTTDLAKADEIIALLEDAAANRNFRSHDRQYYRTMLEVLAPTGFAKIGLVGHEGELVSAAIVFDHNGVRAYAHAGNNPKAREVKSSVPLVWKLLIDARARGLERFDLWGVAPPGASRDHPWAGFSQFKRSFGGEDVAYPGTWDLQLKRVKTAVILTARRAAKHIKLPL